MDFTWEKIFIRTCPGKKRENVSVLIGIIYALWIKKYCQRILLEFQAFILSVQNLNIKATLETVSL